MTDTKELRELEKAATPCDSEWYAEYESAQSVWWIFTDHGDSRELLCGVYKESDAKLIVAARNAMPGLLDEVERVQMIPLSERVPDTDRDVYILCTTGKVCAAYYLPEHGIWMGSRGQLAPKFTHWGELPKQPEGV